MTFSMRRVRAIIGFAAMISRLSTDDSSMLIMPINIAVVMTGAIVQASMMATIPELFYFSIMMILSLLLQMLLATVATIIIVSVIKNFN